MLLQFHDFRIAVANGGAQFVQHFAVMFERGSYRVQLRGLTRDGCFQIEDTRLSFMGRPADRFQRARMIVQGKLRG